MPGRYTSLVLLAAAVLVALGGLWPAATGSSATAASLEAAATASLSTARATTAEGAALAQTWADDQGADLVARSLGAGASTGPLVQAHVWASGFLDGTSPYAAPLPEPVWAAAVEVDGEPTAVLVVRVEADGPSDDAGGVSGVLVSDQSLATGLVGLDPQAVLVREAVDSGGISREDAWYAVSKRTVSALGSTASAQLAGAVPMVTYAAVLRDRSTPTATTVEPSGADEGDSDLMVWVTSGGVVLIGLAILLLTIRHERRVMAPLRT
ncbi:MAG: hypothetical protein Q4C85_01870 [Actinomyces sp.]|uniref:hypothetical protein n=1 Tax=Actinomyces sp. TaxID=29317 RepID=UPI0026DBB127|nr:hypothetical protein [Actinomyces sp.]MDO4242508.1 hypothetical protein [Actinomyces sp.]